MRVMRITLSFALGFQAACAAPTPSAQTVAPVQAAATSQPAEGQRWQQDVSRLAQPLIDEGIVPGLSIGILADGRSETYGLGIADPEAHPGISPNAETLYELGSLTKVLTALLLADSVQRGEVTLDEPLSKLVPQGVTAPTREGKEITLEMLSTHYSGLPRLPSNLEPADPQNPYANYDRTKLFNFLSSYRLTREPGSEFEYSNLGVGLLGTLLAAAAHDEYGALLHDRILVPLAMLDTSVALTERQQARLASAHSGGRKVPRWDFGVLAPCGGVYSSVQDLLKLMAAQLEPASSPLAPQLGMLAQRRRENERAAQGQALGWSIARDGVTLWHTGQTGGYSTAMFVTPAAKKAVVVLANGSDTLVDAMAEKLIQTALGMHVEPPKLHHAIQVPAGELERVVGTYSSKLGLTINVTRDADVLMAQVTGQPALRIYPASPTRYFYRAVDAEIEFALDKERQHATALTLFQNGQKYTLERALSAPSP